MEGQVPPPNPWAVLHVVCLVTLVCCVAAFGWVAFGAALEAAL